MIEIIDKLNDHYYWTEFLEYKLSQENFGMTAREREDLRKFVEEKEYESIVSKIGVSKSLSTPRMLEVNKNGVQKKRIVFTFSREENFVLKMTAYLLKEYDGLFCGNLYSFRNDTGVKKAVGRIRRTVSFDRAYSYKADIHDYFNSIDTDELLEMVKTGIPGEKWLYEFFCNVLRDPYALRYGRKTEVKKGAMAGTPTANFFANLYLRDMDKWFRDKRAVYLRYSDDIIVFSYDPEEIDGYERRIKEMIAERRLTVNPLKEVRTVPGETVEFLGFEFSDREINISGISEKKIKAKLRRKARALYRWKTRKGADDERTVRAYIRFLNNKFYHNCLKGEITWCRWYFPIITSDSKLKRIDDHAVSNIRYLCTGRHGKKNYGLRYDEIVGMGFRSLVNNYWKFRKGKYYADDAPDNE